MAYIKQYTNNVFFRFLPTEYYTTTNCVVTTTCSEIAGRRSRNKMASPDGRPSQRRAEYRQRNEVCQKKNHIFKFRTVSPTTRVNFVCLFPPTHKHTHNSEKIIRFLNYVPSPVFVPHTYVKRSFHLHAYFASKPCNARTTRTKMYISCKQNVIFLPS